MSADLERAVEAARRLLTGAPTDGTVVDLWCEFGPLTGHPERLPDCWYHEGLWWKGDAVPGNEAFPHCPTHWLPIPPPPVERKKDA